MGPAGISIPSNMLFMLACYDDNWAFDIDTLPTPIWATGGFDLLITDTITPDFVEPYSCSGNISPFWHFNIHTPTRLNIQICM